MVVDDQKILEQRRRWPVWESTTHKILERTSPLITPDLSSMADDDPSGADSIEQRLGLRSRIVVPIRIRDKNVRLVGSLTLAHRETVHYGEDEARPLEFIATLIGTWLGQLEARRTADEFVESAKVTSQLETDPASWRSEEELLTTILPAIGSTGLRLYRITEDGDGVRLVASAGHWRNNGSDQDDKLWPVSLSDLPWHRWALSDGAPLQVNQSDPEALMGDRELHAAMTANMKTGWIVPVRSGDRTYGFLDAMEARNPDRQTIREPQQLILHATAAAIARRWAANSVPSKPQVSDGWRKQLRALNGTVVNPITGIIGAVELIRHKQTELTGETIKYLNLIEHSATRIHETLLGALDRVSEDNSEHTGNRSETIARRLFGALTRPADMNPQAATEGRSRLGTVIPQPFAMAETTVAKDAQTD
jgi:GAF domain-containing protein